MVYLFKIIKRISNFSDEKLEVAICLDTVGGAGPLRMHASKAPSDESAAGQLLKRLKVFPLKIKQRIK